MNKIYHNEAEQGELCRKYLSGKQSRKEFCAAHEISPKTLSRWLSKNKSGGVVQFTPLGRIEASAELNMEIILPNGIRIKTPMGHEKLQQLIRGLLRCS